MKKILCLFIITILLTSCSSSTQKNNDEQKEIKEEIKEELNNDNKEQPITDVSVKTYTNNRSYSSSLFKDGYTYAYCNNPFLPEEIEIQSWETWESNNGGSGTTFRIVSKDNAYLVSITYCTFTEERLPQFVK